MRIARVFPTKTRMCPDDPDAYFGFPPENVPEYDEIHISVTFTWDIPKIERLQKAWSKYGFVKVGGPALGDPGSFFVPGLYLKHGATITSRGCPNKCSFCFVHRREGALRELPIVPGHIIQDNNLLACSERHVSKVFEMLQGQKKIDFVGGFEASRITPDLVSKLKQIKLYQLWLAYDTPQAKGAVENAIALLRPHFNQNKIRCYVLVGYGNDTVLEAQKRLEWVYNLGALPFAMLYHTHIEWKKLHRLWTRPAAMRSVMKLNEYN